MGFDKFKRPIDARTASALDVKFDTFRETFVATTGPSTSFGPRGVFSFTSTSTGAVGHVFDIAADFKAGDRLTLMIDATTGSTTPWHFKFGSATVAASSADRLVMSTVGSGVSLIAISTSRWLVTGNVGATFSTST